jgi:hypothetical protein
MLPDHLAQLMSSVDFPRPDLEGRWCYDDVM